MGIVLWIKEPWHCTVDQRIMALFQQIRQLWLTVRYKIDRSQLTSEFQKQYMNPLFLTSLPRDVASYLTSLRTLVPLISHARIVIPPESRPRRWTGWTARIVKRQQASKQSGKDKSPKASHIVKALIEFYFKDEKCYVQPIGIRYYRSSTSHSCKRLHIDTKPN